MQSGNYQSLLESKGNYLNQIEAQHLPIETSRSHKLIDIDPDGGNNNDGGNDEFKSIFVFIQSSEAFFYRLEKLYIHNDGMGSFFPTELNQFSGKTNLVPTNE